MRTLVGAVLMAASVTRVANAQACLGTASFFNGPARIAAGLDVGDSRKAYGAEVAVGAPAGAFASGGISRVAYDNVDGNGTGFSANVGYALNLASTRTVQLCPIASFDYEKAPSIETGIGTFNASAHGFGFGGSLGTIIPASPTFDVVPFAGARFIAARGNASFAGSNVTDSKNYTNIDLGAGFVVNRTWTIRPEVTMPVGVEGAKATFAIAFAVNVGSSRK